MEGNGRFRPRDPGDAPRGPSLTPDPGHPAVAAPGTGRRVAVAVFLLMLIPVLAAALVFPALRTQPFGSVAEIEPAEIKSLAVRLLNRTELDGGPDIGPYTAAAEDYAKLLEPLKAVPAVEGYVDARGPWLGEYRVLLLNGRKATIRLYWHRDPKAPSAAPVTLRFQIGDKTFAGGTAAALIAAVTECEGRGRAK